eukprot:622465_1
MDRSLYWMSAFMQYIAYILYGATESHASTSHFTPSHWMPHECSSACRPCTPVTYTIASRVKERTLFQSITTRSSQCQGTHIVILPQSFTNYAHLMAYSSICTFSSSLNDYSLSLAYTTFTDIEQEAITPALFVDSYAFNTSIDHFSGEYADSHMFIVSFMVGLAIESPWKSQMITNTSIPVHLITAQKTWRTNEVDSNSSRVAAHTHDLISLITLVFVLIFSYLFVRLSSSNDMFLVLTCSYIMSTVYGFTSLPNNCFSIALGYNEAANMFHLISGQNTAECISQHVIFDIDNDIFTDESPLPFTIQQPGTNNNWYVQVGNLLYLVDYVSTGTIHTFDVVTEAYVYDVAALEVDFTPTSCWTSLLDDSANTYLVGYFTDDVYFYSLTNNSWVRTTATATTARRNVACVSYETVLYIIGGEENNGGDVDFNSLLIYTYGSNAFETLTDTLSVGVRNSKAIVYDDYIYNIGGDDDDDVDIYYPTIDVITPLNFSIDTIESYKARTDIIAAFPYNMSDKLDKVAAVILFPFLYRFGGRNASAVGVHTSDKLVVFPTIAPTHAPTITPTIAPTIAPTSTPTIAPTHAPTIAPTHAPTIAPTHAPTIAPTH